MANNQSVRRHLMFLPKAFESLRRRKAAGVISVAAEFGNAHSIVSMTLRQFQTTGKAMRGPVVSSTRNPTRR
ncbi:hypothetical protein TNCV_4545041 [Trichonephila clavipes]|nr:hypothetical protein TNCV_4545041 [Trichonephila clavipes]